jgi:hypothetical protein
VVGSVRSSWKCEEKTGREAEAQTWERVWQDPLTDLWKQSDMIKLILKSGHAWEDGLDGKETGGRDF